MPAEQPPLPTGVDKRYAADLRVGEYVSTTFLLSRCELRTTVKGDPYLALELTDRTGTISGRMWNGAQEAARKVATGDFVVVEGIVDTWQQAPQIKLDKLERASDQEIDPSDYLQSSKRDADEMYRELLERVDGIRNPHLKQLLQRTFRDPEIAARFRRAPGGMKLHHAYLGGLLEHTLSVVHLAARVADHYPHLDRDLLLAGAFLHDLGKIWEMSYERAFDYTERGRLVGHLLMEASWVSKLIDEIDGFPERLRDHLMHLLASHHGLHEHGAPVRPATPEALALHYVDDLDSKMAAIGVAIAEARQTGNLHAWSPSLGRRVLGRRWDEVEGD